METITGIKEKLVIFSILFIIFVGIYYIKSKSNYIDPINSCYIYIEDDMLRGNNKTIFEAIKKIKNEDMPAYRTLCSSVDVVSENFCEGGNRQTNIPIKPFNNEACYIKGSKIIYLEPTKDESVSTVEKRAEMLKKYSLRSQEFWQNLNVK